MLVHRLIGPYAGSVVDMIFDDVRRAEANGAARRLTVDEAARYATGSADIAEGVPSIAVVAVPVKKIEEKRRPGWPKGKPRGVYVRPEILA